MGRAIKGQAVANLLELFLGEGTTALREDLPGEFPDISVVEEESWLLYFDGSATPRNNTGGAGIVLVSPTGEVFSHSFKLDFKCTNNSAEYEAFLIGLLLAKQARSTCQEIRGDSKLLVNQMNGVYTLKEERELLEEYGIKQIFSTIYYPQGNGKSESTKKTLFRILSRTVHDNPKEWHEQLPMALWACRTAPRSSIGVSPYSLVYSADAILPAEIKIPSARIAAASGVHWNEAKASNSRIAELDTLDSIRSKEEERTQVYRNRISMAYDKTVKPRVFKVGDLALKTAKHIQQDMYAPKFSPKWEGPYMITKAYSTGYYKIVKVDGGKLEAVINEKWLKAYHD
ncbi:uncharacterized protein LOC113350921 [Papaver somniferum]|uniref:uncharacterized protein LOC113350921 n=1 Tax=Papaver somniferum TaxID=3469 RepID=UPI000E705732|nr:uncharacterized protein LOC113350921 [Papaver somniferum]